MDVKSFAEELIRQTASTCPQITEIVKSVFTSEPELADSSCSCQSLLLFGAMIHDEFINGQFGKEPVSAQSGHFVLSRICERAESMGIIGGIREIVIQPFAIKEGFASVAMPQA